MANHLIKTIKSIEEFKKELPTLLNLTIQNLDFRKENIDWKEVRLANTTFLGCDFEMETQLFLKEKGAYIYPKIVGLPYNPYRKELYSWEELMGGYDIENDQSQDLKIYEHFMRNKFTRDVNESLAQHIHDNSIDNALRDLIGLQDDGMTTKKAVAVMGGHRIQRDDPAYLKVALVTKKLTEDGYFILSGGGPGMMESANLGAYFANKPEKDLLKAVEILKKAPNMHDKDFVIQSKKVIEKYPKGEESLSIPTWFYGHEPSNLFATHIAKYFSNAIREDMLLALAIYGIIYAPGSAGTIQEVFQDAAQGQYASFGYVSPMVFFGRKFWSEDTFIYQLLKQMSKGHTYHDLIGIGDEVDEIVTFIKEHPPIKENK
jgi:predicted Rossmann-fold nucleotide-binding protein